MTSGARRVDCGFTFHLLSCPRCPVRCQRGHPERLRPVAPTGEPTRLVERGSGARIIRTVALEDRQSGLRAGHSIACNLAQFGHAELDH
jgi:hypothetical protein